MKHSKVTAGLAVAVLAVNATLSPSLILADSLTDTSNTSQTQTVEKTKISYNANGGRNAGDLFNDEISTGGEYQVRSLGTSSGQLNFVAPNAKQIFVSWNTRPDGTGTTYNEGQTVANWNYSSDTILYAQWSDTSNLSFNLNGATGNTAPAQKTGTIGSNIVVPDIPSDLTPKDSTTEIVGVWNTRADGTGTDYAPGSSYALEKTDTTLYLKIKAKSTEHEPLLTFNSNGGHTTNSELTSGIKGSVDDVYYITLPDATPEKVSYKFTGWLINGKIYKAGEKVQIFYSTEAVAQWSPLVLIDFSKGYDTTTAANNMPDSATIDATGQVYQLPDNIPSRPNENGKQYIFVGWKLNGTTYYPGSKVTTPRVAASWDFEAVWYDFNLDSYSIGYNGNGNTGGSPEEPYSSVVKGEELTIPGPGKLTKSGHEFIGWEYEVDADTKIVYLEGDVITPQKNMVLKAKWRATSSEGALKFESNAKAGSNPAAIVDTNGTKITLPDVMPDNVPTEDNYKFWGWSTDKAAAYPEYYAGNSYTISTGTKTLYGVWAPTSDRYWTHLKIDANGAEGLPSGFEKNNVYKLGTATETKSITIPTDDGLKYEGYRFTGWKFTQEGEEEKIYQPGETLTLKDISETKNPVKLTAQWERIKYEVKYDMGDATSGTVPPNSTIELDFKDSHTVLGNPGSLAKEKALFVGWTDGSQIYTPGQSMKPTEDTVLTPAWKTISDSNGSGTGQTNMVNMVYVALESGVIGETPASASVRGDFTERYTVAEPLANFSLPGKVFDYWYVIDAKGNEVAYSPGTSFIAHQDMIFYAKWKTEVEVPADSFTIMFNGNGHTSGLVPDQIYRKDGVNFTMPKVGKLAKYEYYLDNDKNVIADPYLFLGWSTDKNAKAGDASIVAPDTVVKASKDTVYYAIWDKEKRNVLLTYDGNGYTGGDLPDSTTLPRYETAVIDPNKQGMSMVKTTIDEDTGEELHYIFGGWNTKADGKGTDYYPGGKLSLKTDTELYAKWIPLKPSNGLTRVIYLANSDTSSTYLRYTDEKTTPFSIQDRGAFTNTGYMFTGWNTKADGTGKQYNPGESVTPSSTSLILHAQWKPVEANKMYIVYDGNGKTNGEVPEAYVGLPNDTVQLPSSEDVNKLGMKKTGYIFSGWSTTPTAQGIMYPDGVSQKFSQNTVLYAVWAKDGNYIATPSTVTYHQNHNDLTDTYVVKGAVDAKATVDDINVLHGHKVVADEVNGGAYYGETHKLPDLRTAGFAEREKFDFLGWSTDPNATEATYQPEDEFTLARTKVDLYAVWKTSAYQVSYDANKGEGTMADQEFVFDVKQDLSANTFWREGYHFVEWNTEADRTGKAYTDKENVENLVPTYADAITLFAQWEANSYQVKFDANEGSGKMKNQTFTYDEMKALRQNEFKRDNYKFTGWNTKADGTGEKYANKAQVLNLLKEDKGQVTLYAQWRKNKTTTIKDVIQNNKSDGTTKKNPLLPRTGDAASFIPLGILGAGLIALGAFILKRKRKE
ncbi:MULTISPECIES: InlB B-repeat-containing protein [unclassified Lactococcus]|uniref:InlB B-repeat-containing protein n=1 Tax=unclassified Lactococcus TaxID=2643510 RepID=UPI0011CB152E|nr:MULTISPECIES: InlB B-repeat-containing protein [unclassified Lactococcus]MQW22624.1 LPXTG cell wall anchor domain-containing protein [Lactococcus sp. dk101]TXK45644.1 LPXTG cell wall anchor domain-containing protein [Lactococcus sp. dk310]TXK51496.1 LPXTG cell wall anchor domain-containing protein [Lactococcus sp. dk322]